MTKVFFILGLGFLVSTATAKPAAKPVVPQCFKADTVDIWEKKYCFRVTHANDEESEVFRTCAEKVFKDKSLPKKACPRIQWLKDKACFDDPPTGNTRKACLTDKDYLKKIEANPPSGL